MEMVRVLKEMTEKQERKGGWDMEKERTGETRGKGDGIWRGKGQER
jgi:hypothetical protein